MIKKKEEKKKEITDAKFITLSFYRYALLSLTVITFRVILDISSLEFYRYMGNVASYVSSFSFHSPLIIRLFAGIVTLLEYIIPETGIIRIE